MTYPQISIGFKSILFDFDGVILDSAHLKTEAFATCYAGEAAEAVAKVVRYQEEHGGVSRRAKFKYFEQAIFNRTGDKTSVDALCETFSNVIRSQMLTVEPIAGALGALKEIGKTAVMHVVSGMPETELTEVLAARRLDGFFKTVAGAPKTKLPEFARILRDEKLHPREAVAVGDSLTEYQAAEALGIPFIAIIGVRTLDLFPESVKRLPDLTDLPAVLAAMQA